MKLKTVGSRLVKALFATTVGAVLLAGLLTTACDSPTEPEPTPPAGPDPGAVATRIDITVGDAASLETGASAVITVTVAKSGLPDPPITQVGLSTTLGNFGTDSSGNPIQTVTCTVSSTTCPLDDQPDQIVATVTFFAGDEEGTARMIASVGDVTGNATIEITAPPPFFLQRIDPTFGPPDGGTEVTIFGQGFRDNPRTTFGGALATFVAAKSDLAAGRLVVETPASATPVAVGATLTVDVAVQLPDDGSGTTAQDTLDGAFTYAFGDTPVGPAILSVDPTTGPNRGGIDVVLSGSGFDTSGVTVAFGQGMSAEDFSGLDATVTSLSPTRVIVTLPPASTDLLNQTVGVLLRNTSTGLSALASSIFTYVEEDKLTDIQPRSGTYLGGTDVVLTTRGLDPDDDLTIEFGGQVQQQCRPGSTCLAADGTITVEAIAVGVQNCEPPSGAAMITDTVTGETSTGPTFSYTADVPAVAQLDPPRGAEGGGFPIAIGGTFSAVEEGLTVVLIDGQQAAITDFSAGTITVTAPAFSGTFDEQSCGTDGTQLVAKQVDVEVLYSRTGCSVTQSGGFTYDPSDTSCSEPGQAPVASFAATVSGDDRLTVTFQDTSSGSPTAWSWSFGDGQSSNVQNPTIQYTEGGTFNVTLIASNDAGSSSVTQAVTVGLDPAEADFEFTVDGLDVTFVDRSMNADTYLWDFGDGQTSTEQNPSHTYGSVGTWNVTLTASNASSSDQITKQVSTTLEPPTAAFGFSFSALDSNRLRIDFQDQSNGVIDAWEWFFGDGGTSTQQNPSHLYAEPDTYTVSLRVSNAAGSDTFSQDIQAGPDPPEASFVFSLTGNGNEVEFIDTSAGTITGRVWFFGDGNQSAGTLAASQITHTYAGPGTFTVTLQISNIAGTSTASLPVTIPDPP